MIGNEDEMYILDCKLLSAPTNSSHSKNHCEFRPRKGLGCRIILEPANSRMQRLNPYAPRILAKSSTHIDNRNYSLLIEECPISKPVHEMEMTKDVMRLIVSVFDEGILPDIDECFIVKNHVFIDA